jgi:parallel beta-helix repeat protein
VTAALAVAAVLAAAMPAAATTRVVKPGESIQAAIDKSQPGDTVSVRKGTYKEFLQLIDKDRVTLKGHHAVLKPAATVTPTLCNSMGDITGICVAGRLGAPVGDNPPPVLRQARSDRITGFKITGFKSNGIFGFGTTRLRIDHNTLSKNGEYGAFSNTSTRTRMERNVVSGNKGEAGLYVGDSPSARAVVTRNRITNNHGSGLFVRSASRGTASRNRISGNCLGIWVLADAPGPAGHWTLSRNRVSKNNRACAPDADEGTPALSGIGIALSGANHTKVTRNRVTGNRHLHDTVISGGIILRRASLTSGTAPTKDVVSRNVLARNRPFDIDWDKVGAVKFSRNTCGRATPANACS